MAALAEVTVAIQAVVVALVVVLGVGEDGGREITGRVDLVTTIIPVMNHSRISNIWYIIFSQLMQSAGFNSYAIISLCLASLELEIV